jgi:hypothetical protein
LATDSISSSYVPQEVSPRDHDVWLGVRREGAGQQLVGSEIHVLGNRLAVTVAQGRNVFLPC